MRLGSNTSPQIWQADPELGHRRASGWRTINGYFNEAKQLTKCLLINAKRTKPYPLEAVIKFSGDVTPDDHNTVWKMYTKNMRRRGITAVWVREPTRKNRIHYHLILTAPDAIEAAEQALRSSCLKGYTDRLELHVKAVEYQRAICEYVTKAKVKGYNDHGDYVVDKYGHKRLLFADHIKLDKHGSVGPFWHSPKEQIWREVVEREKGIALFKGEVCEEARRLHKLVADDLPRWRVERNLAYFAWRESLLKPESATDG